MSGKDRKSARIEEKSRRVFKMPSREERLAATNTSTMSSTVLSELSPRKRVNNFTKITNRYNADDIDVFDSESSVEDFIDDDEEVECSETSSESNDNQSSKESDDDERSENSEPPVKKLKKRHFCRIKRATSESEDDEPMVKPSPSVVLHSEENKDSLQQGVASLSCSDDTQMSEPKQQRHDNVMLLDSAVELTKSPETNFYLSSSGISMGHSPIQALSSDFDDDDECDPQHLPSGANCSAINHTVGGALESDSEYEFDYRPSLVDSGVSVLRHTSCSDGVMGDGDPFAYGGLNQFQREAGGTCASLGSASDNDVVTGYDEAATVDQTTKSDDSESDQDHVFRRLNTSHNISRCVNSESEDSDEVTRSGGRKAGSSLRQQIQSSDSETDCSATTPKRPRSQRVSRLSAKKEQWKKETIGALVAKREKK